MKTLLVACEESQRVCTAFRQRGWEAYSCDIIDCSGGHPEYHIKQDVIPLLNGNCDFETGDGVKHHIDRWDMLIAHPPCTYLSNAGACRLYPRKGELNIERYQKDLDAKEFFLKFLNANIPHIAVENPIPTRVYNLPRYTQTIQPYEYGHPYSKKTCLWLKDLPELQPTNTVEPICSWVSGGSKNPDGSSRENKGMKFRDSKTKSKTFEGIAEAMAEQWTKYLEEEC